MVSPRRKLLVAIGIGVVLAGPPVAALNIWLGGLLERQGRDELELTAQRSLALAETRISRAVKILNDIVALGVDSCGDGAIEAFRLATFETTPVKELSVVAIDGRTLCTDVGHRPEARKLVSSEPISAGNQFLLEVIQLGGAPQRWIRIHRPGTGRSNGIAALIPAELFVAQVSTEGRPQGFHIQMRSTSGSLIGEVGRPASAAERNSLVVATLPSKRNAIQASVSASQVTLNSNYIILRVFGMVTSGLLAVVIIGAMFLLYKRERDNPITELERALNAGEFVPYYQPIVDITSGRLRGAEVLIRWRKADGSVVSPAMFIALAESSGLIIEMTYSLMRRVCREVGPVLGLRPHINIGFNLAACHFANEEIVDNVRKIFEQSQLRLSQLVLEVTERQPIENLTETRRIVAALQGLGAKVAIDDVGTGHSGLSYMLKLGVDMIKIDKIFIDSLGTDHNSNAIIGTLIDLARNMRMDVVAEGVENFEQVMRLRDLGVCAAQGFVFAPPLPSSAFLQLVESIDPIKPANEQSTDEPIGVVADAKANVA